MTLLKLCNRCLQQLPLSSFGKTKTGLKSRCKSCLAALGREHRQAHPSSDQQKQAAVKRVQQWRESNPEKAQILRKRYYDCHKAEVIARAKKRLSENPCVRKSRYDSWRKRNATKVQGYCKKWRLNHPDKARQSVRHWVEEHPLENKLAQKRWAIAHPSHRHQRRGVLKNGDFTYAQWVEVLDVFDHRCAYCFAKGLELTMDHLHPVSRNGQHTKDNIVPACRSCNSIKHDRPIWVMVNVKESNHGTTS